MKSILPSEQNSQDIERWVSQHYYGQLSSMLASALDYLHNSVNWGLGVATGIIALVFIRQKFPDDVSWLILWLSLPLTTYFATRAAKGYLNVIRWSTLQRYILRYKTGIPDCPDITQVVKLMVKYHDEWQSPLLRKDVALKALHELGYGYFLLLTLSLIIYAGLQISLGPFLIVTAAVTGALSVFQFTWLLWCSPYLRHVCPDEVARKLR